MLAPSKAHLWVPCSLAGNVLASGNYHTAVTDGAEMSDSRREGICAAWAAETAINQPEAALVGLEHPNGWRVDREMAHHIRAYLDYCRQWGDVIKAEVPVDLFGGIIRGRVDATNTFGGVSASNTIRIFDLKYGWRIVEARQNWAMLCYGLAEAVDSPGADIELHIYQPRPHHPDGPARVWRIAAAEVPAWSEWLYAVASEARDNPRATPGDHCGMCPAQAGCVAHAKMSYALFADQAERRQHNHTAAEIAAEMRFLDMAADVLKARQKAIYAEAAARLRRGEYLPGVAMVPTTGHREWIAERDVIELATGRSLMKEEKKSPAEMEKEGVRPDVINMLSKKPSRGMKVTLDVEKYRDELFGKVT